MSGHESVERTWAWPCVVKPAPLQKPPHHRLVCIPPQQFLGNWFQFHGASHPRKSGLNARFLPPEPQCVFAQLPSNQPHTHALDPGSLWSTCYEDAEPDIRSRSFIHPQQQWQRRILISCLRRIPTRWVQPLFLLLACVPCRTPFVLPDI